MQSLKNLDIQLMRNGVEREKSWISFSPQYSPTLLFSCHLSTSRRFWNFRSFCPHFLPYFFALFDPSKWVRPRWAKNLNCKYNYLITPGSFLEFDPPWTVFQGVYLKYYLKICYYYNNKNNTYLCTLTIHNFDTIMINKTFYPEIFFRLLNFRCCLQLVFCIKVRKKHVNHTIILEIAGYSSSMKNPIESHVLCA